MRSPCSADIDTTEDTTFYPGSSFQTAGRDPLEETQHRLNLRTKAKHNVHPRVLVAFVTESLSTVVHYHRARNMWDSFYAKHH